MEIEILLLSGMNPYVMSECMGCRVSGKLHSNLQLLCISSKRLLGRALQLILCSAACIFLHAETYPPHGPHPLS